MGKGRFSKIWVFFLLLLVILSLAYLALMPDIASLKKKDPGKTAFMEYREK